ncbi:MAG: AI-2E family transporter [Bacteroidota bacterium]|nr:AI-2E family transporter [Bacteroidota bacterium]MDP3144041.1 AI-2E family transporter [Bacteroidota bacterium]
MTDFIEKKSEQIKATGFVFIKNLFLLFLVIACLYFAKEFLMPLAIGGVVATLFLPFCKWMEEKRIFRGAAVFICVFVLLLFITGIGALLGWQISELANDISIIKERAIQASVKIQEYIFSHFGITIEKQSQLIKTHQPSVSGIIPIMAGSFASLVTNFSLTIIYIFGLLYYRDHIKSFLFKLSPPNKINEMKIVINSVTKVSQQYLVGLSKMIFILWIMYGIGFSIIGIENALFFAILCGLLEIVPYIGNITGTLITVLVAAVQGASPPMIFGILGTYGFVQLFQGWVLEPLILGSQVKINPLFTIISLVIGQLIWGIPGIFLAIPLIAMFKIVCDNIDSLKPYGFLIGEIRTAKKESTIIKKIKNWFKMKIVKNIASI